MFTIVSNMCSQYCQTNVHNIFKQTFTMFILVFPIFHKSIHNTSKKYSPYFNQIYPNTSTPHICDKSIHNFWFSVVDCECGRLRWQREASACLERWPGGSTVMSIAMSIVMSIANCHVYCHVHCHYNVHCNVHCGKVMIVFMNLMMNHLF